MAISLRGRPGARIIALGAILIQTIPSSSQAVLRRHDRPDSLYQALARSDTRALGNLAGAVGTVIADRWVLTAAHVALNLSPFSRSFRLGATTYPIADVYIHPGFGSKHGPGGSDAIDLEVPDLALVRLARPVRGVDPLRLSLQAVEPGRLIVVAGNGVAGSGESGPTDEDDVMRAATNVIDEVSGRYFTFSFSAPGDSGVTDLEGIGGPGDSGSPALVRGAGGLEVLGVSSLNSRAGAAGSSQYRSIEVYASVPASRDWIDSVLAGRVKPEPVRDVVHRVSDGWPATPAGRLASRWLDAYNRRDSLALVDFERAFRADSLLTKKPAEKRASTWLGLYEEWGRLEPASWAETPGQPMRVLVHEGRHDRWMRFDFVMQPGPPYKLTGMRTNQPEDPPASR